MQDGKVKKSWRRGVRQFFGENRKSFRSNPLIPFFDFLFFVFYPYILTSLLNFLTDYRDLIIG
jgi:hypothetical protein